MNFENCCKCGEALKKIKTPRQRFIKCADCRGVSVSAKFRKIQDDCKAKSKSVPEEEMFIDESNVIDDQVMYRRKVYDHSNLQSSLGDLGSFSLNG
tara:strand:+ start:28 stop:315 length:288 start_codon:yes stop_codon:yes gene_type:complete